MRSTSRKSALCILCNAGFLSAPTSFWWHVRRVAKEMRCFEFIPANSSVSSSSSKPDNGNRGIFVALETMARAFLRPLQRNTKVVAILLLHISVTPTYCIPFSTPWRNNIDKERREPLFIHYYDVWSDWKVVSRILQVCFRIERVSLDI